MCFRKYRLNIKPRSVTFWNKKNWQRNCFEIIVWFSFIDFETRLHKCYFSNVVLYISLRIWCAYVNSDIFCIFVFSSSLLSPNGGSLVIYIHVDIDGWFLCLFGALSAQPVLVRNQFSCAIRRHRCHDSKKKIASRLYTSCGNIYIYIYINTT